MRWKEQWIAIVLVVWGLSWAEGLRGSALILQARIKAEEEKNNPSPSPPPSADEEGGAEGGNTTISGSTEKPKPKLTGIPQKDYIYDPNLPRELKGFDLSTYPFYNKIPPDIEFECDGLHDGFYASVPHHCQVYHHCLFGTRYDFLCANYTAFDQKTFICHFVSEIDCEGSPKYYKRNEALYKAATTTPVPTTKPPTTTTTQAPTTEAARRPGGGGRRRRPLRPRRPAYEYYYDDDEYDDEDYYEDDLPPPRKSSSRRQRPSGGRGREDDEEEEDNNKMTVQPKGSSGSVYDRPRVPPKIRRPVPLNERDKYDYTAKPGQAPPTTPTTTTTASTTTAASTTTTTPPPSQEDLEEDDEEYYDDEEYDDEPPKRKYKSDYDPPSARDKGMRRRGQPMSRKRPSRYDDDYEEERPRTRKGNRREESYPRNRNRGYRKGDRYRDDEDDSIAQERYPARGSSSRKRYQEMDKPKGGRRPERRPMYEEDSAEEDEYEYYEDEEEEEQERKRTRTRLEDERKKGGSRGRVKSRAEEKKSSTTTRGTTTTTTTTTTKPPTTTSRAPPTARQTTSTRATTTTTKKYYSRSTEEPEYDDYYDDESTVASKESTSTTTEAPKQARYTFRSRSEVTPTTLAPHRFSTPSPSTSHLTPLQRFRPSAEAKAKLNAAIANRKKPEVTQAPPSNEEIGEKPDEPEPTARPQPPTTRQSFLRRPALKVVTSSEAPQPESDEESPSPPTAPAVRRPPLKLSTSSEASQEREEETPPPPTGPAIRRPSPKPSDSEEQPKTADEVQVPPSGPAFRRPAFKSDSELPFRRPALKQPEREDSFFRRPGKPLDPPPKFQPPPPPPPRDVEPTRNSPNGRRPPPPSRPLGESEETPSGPGLNYRNPFRPFETESEEYRSEVPPSRMEGLNYRRPFKSRDSLEETRKPLKDTFPREYDVREPSAFKKPEPPRSTYTFFNTRPKRPEELPKVLPKSVEVTAPGPSGPEDSTTPKSNGFLNRPTGFSLDLEDEEYDVTLNDALQPSTLHPTQSLGDLGLPYQPRIKTRGFSSAVTHPSGRAPPYLQAFYTRERDSIPESDTREYEAVVIPAPRFTQTRFKQTRPREWYW